MAIATFDDFERRFLTPDQTIKKIVNTSAQGKISSQWTSGPLAGTAPTTAAVPARNAVGALGQENGGGTALRMVGFPSIRSWARGVWLLCDRLSHQGGLSGTATGAQTTNLPTAALTRYTDGVGVMCALEVYTSVGSTATTVTVSYTDQDGNTGQTSPAIPFGGTQSASAAPRMHMIPLASGDYGVRAVASVTLAATTGTAGNFGVTLFKPLAWVLLMPPDVSQENVVSGHVGGGLPEILDDACLWWLYSGPDGSGQSASIAFAAD